MYRSRLEIENIYRKLKKSCLPPRRKYVAYSDDNSVINLWPLGYQNKTARFSGVKAPDQRMYSYNPCYPFSVGACKDSVICQNNTKKMQTIATLSTPLFTRDGDDVLLTYVYAMEGITRYSTVTLVCVENLDSPRFKAYGQQVNQTYLYTFQLETKCACGDGCPLSSSSGGGLGAGWVILIIFIVVVFLYLSLGMVHSKVTKDASGLQLIPHYEFWSSLPGLAKDGCVYVCTCACLRPKQAEYDSV